VVRIGAAVASLGVLLSLIAGVSRTMFAMAAARDLPPALAAVHPKYRTPHRAELAGGAVILVLVAFLDVGEAIGFSSFTVLAYYAIANAAALTLSAGERRWPRPLAGVGLAGCVLIAVNLPTATVIGGAIALGAGLLVFGLRRAFGALAAAAILIAPSAARAVDPFEIQVHDGTVGGPGSVGIELNAKTVVSGQRTAVPPELPSHHQSHFTLEPAFGITDWGSRAERGAVIRTGRRDSFRARRARRDRLEYYANFWLPASAQEHDLFEVIDVLRWKWLELNAGVGEGFTDGSNHFIEKMIVGFHR
jgi:hypothetical protein